MIKQLNNLKINYYKMIMKIKIQNLMKLKNKVYYKI